jgi:hypothetical protein
VAHKHEQTIGLSHYWPPAAFFLFNALLFKDLAHSMAPTAIARNTAQSAAETMVSSTPVAGKLPARHEDDEQCENHHAGKHHDSAQAHIPLQSARHVRPFQMLPRLRCY